MFARVDLDHRKLQAADSLMRTNSIEQVKTVEVDGPNGPAVAMMIALDVNDVAAVDEFVQSVAERFKLERMLAPPSTFLVLFTIIGDLSADDFASRWHAIQQSDPVIHAFMSLMEMADVIQDTPSGEKLSNASLI